MKNILSSSLVNLKTLERFAGKVVSFNLAILGCKLYVCEVFRAIAQPTRSSKLATKVQGGLRSDIQYWRFLDDWSDCLGGRNNTALSPCFAMPLNARGEQFSSKMEKGSSLGIIGWILRKTSTLLKLGLCSTLSLPSEIISANLGLTFTLIV